MHMCMYIEHAKTLKHSQCMWTRQNDATEDGKTREKYSQCVWTGQNNATKDKKHAITAK